MLPINAAQRHGRRNWAVGTSRFTEQETKLVLSGTVKGQSRCSAAPMAQRGQGAMLCYHCEEIPISSTKTRNIANPNINPAMRINDHKSRNQSRIQQRKPMSMQCHCGRRSARSRVHCSRSEGFRASASTLQVEGGVRVVGVKVLTRVLRSAMRPELHSSPNVAQRI